MAEPAAGGTQPALVPYRENPCLEFPLPCPRSLSPTGASRSPLCGEDSPVPLEFLLRVPAPTAGDSTANTL